MSATTRYEHAQHESRSHHEVELEYLTTVDQKIADAFARNEVFAHDRAYPTQADVYFENG